MTTRLNAYLSFPDTAREAMTFYQSVFGGELTLSTFGDFQAAQDPADTDKIMHSMLAASNEVVLMASDTPKGMEAATGGFSLSLTGDDEAELRAYWDKLSSDGSVRMPLDVAPWGDTFGMCTDRFGVNWMVSISAPSA